MHNLTKVNIYNSMYNVYINSAEQLDSNKSQKSQQTSENAEPEYKLPLYLKRISQLFCYFLQRVVGGNII